jgi:hypothetical protein
MSFGVYVLNIQGYGRRREGGSERKRDLPEMRSGEEGSEAGRMNGMRAEGWCYETEKKEGRKEGRGRKDGRT